MRICKHISISDSVSLTNTTTTTTTAGHFHFCPSTAIFLCSDFFRPVRLALLFLLFCAPKSPPWTQTLMDTWTATKEQKICCPSQSICRNICPSFSSFFFFFFFFSWLPLSSSPSSLLINVCWHWCVPFYVLYSDALIIIIIIICADFNILILWKTPLSAFFNTQNCLCRLVNCCCCCCSIALQCTSSPTSFIQCKCNQQTGIGICSKFGTVFSSLSLRTPDLFALKKNMHSSTLQQPFWWPSLENYLLPPF